jgi:hypothetical protein
MENFLFLDYRQAFGTLEKNSFAYKFRISLDDLSVVILTTKSP